MCPSPFGRGCPDIGSPGVDGPPVMPEDSYAYVVAAFPARPTPDRCRVLVPDLTNFIPEPGEEVYPYSCHQRMRYSQLRSSPCLLLPHPLLIHQAMFLSQTLRRIRRRIDEAPEDPADYPGDGGDDGDDEDESSDDDEDEDVDIEGDEEEHPAPVDSTTVALPAVNHAPSAEETEPFETGESAATPPPHHAYWVTARISIRDEPPTPFWSDTEVARLLAIPTPPPSPLSLWSSPLPQIPSPPLPPILSPLPVLPPLPVSSPPPASPIRLLGYQAVMIRLRAEAPSTSHSPPPHIILSHTRPDAPSSGTPPLQLLFTNRRADIPKVTLPPRKRLGIALGPRYEVGESSSAPTARPPRGFRADYGFVATIDREIMRDLERDVGYGITDTWDEMSVDMPGAQATDDTELG
ncbi:hypothetical protein Tco_0573352 [Tanacetum coccineum]